MPSQKTKVTTYAIPAGTQFTVAMHPQREILAIEPDPRTGGYTFLVEQPAVSADGSDDQSTQEFFVSGRGPQRKIRQHRRRQLSRSNRHRHRSQRRPPRGRDLFRLRRAQGIVCFQQSLFVKKEEGKFAFLLPQLF